MESKKVIRQWENRYETLKTRIRRLELLLVGTITPRMDRRPDPKRPTAVKHYGPYYQWTFKEKGKTKTVNLTPQQARLFGQAIRNHRTLEKTILEMRTLSLKILLATTKGVTPRTRRK